MRCLLLLALVGLTFGYTIEHRTTVGPVQKVITLLQDIKKRVAAEGEVEAEQFAKYQKWCAEETDEKEDAIQEGTARVETLVATVENLTAEVSGASDKIGKLGIAISTNDQDLTAAKKVRANEHSDFQASEQELTETIDMLVRAVSVLKRQLALNQGAKLRAQMTPAKQEVIDALKELVTAAAIKSEDKKKLSALVQQAESEDDDFLSRRAPKGKAYESHSGSIFDTLADLKEKAEGELNKLRKEEMNQKHSFEMLAQSLENELKHQRQHLSQEQQVKATAEEAMGKANADLAATRKTLSEDKKILD